MTGNICPRRPGGIAVAGQAAVGALRPQLVESVLALIALSARHVSLALTLPPDLHRQERERGRGEEERERESECERDVKVKGRGGLQVGQVGL